MCHVNQRRCMPTSLPLPQRFDGPVAGVVKGVSLDFGMAHELDLGNGIRASRTTPSFMRTNAEDGSSC